MSLTLLLQTGHHLDVGQVLQFVSQHDGVVLPLCSTEVTVQGGLGTEDGAAEAAACEHNMTLTVTESNCFHPTPVQFYGAFRTDEQLRLNVQQIK